MNYRNPSEKPPDKILTLLKHGRSNAITGRELAFKLGEPNDRQIRLAIRALIADGTPIASCTDNHKGFFITETREEREAYIQNLKARIRENALRLRDFKRATRALMNPGQLNLL